MHVRIALAALAAILFTAGVASAQPALPDVPVDGRQSVPPKSYAAAAKLAASGATPIEIAAKVAGRFDGRTQQFIQENEGVEAPTAARVTVLRDGLLDDSIRGDRWDIRLERTKAGGWKIAEVQRAWRCRRGDAPDRFAAVKCP